MLQIALLVYSYENAVIFKKKTLTRHGLQQVEPLHKTTPKTLVSCSVNWIPCSSHKFNVLII